MMLASPQFPELDTLCNVATDATMVTFLDLPDIVIKGICEHLSFTTRTTKHRGWSLWPEQSRTDLMNVSLINKRLRGLANTVRITISPTKTFDLVDLNDLEQHDIGRLVALEEFTWTPMLASFSHTDLKHMILKFAHINRKTDFSAASRTPENLSTTIDSLIMAGSTEPDTNAAQRAKDTRFLTAIAKLLAMTKSIEYLELHEGTKESSEFGETGIGVLFLVLSSLQFLRSLSITGEGKPDGFWHSSLVMMNVLKIDSLRNLKLSNIRWVRGRCPSPFRSDSRIEHIEFHSSAIAGPQLALLIGHLHHLDHFVWNAATGCSCTKAKDLLGLLGFSNAPTDHIQQWFATFLVITEKGFHPHSYRSDNPKVKRGAYVKDKHEGTLSERFLPGYERSRVLLDGMFVYDGTKARRRRRENVIARS